MALVVEDGTGNPAAESYISVAEFRAYCAARGYAVDGAPDDTLDEQALRRATTYIDMYGAGRWPGRPLTADQALAWPRTAVLSPGGGYLPASPLPAALRAATCEAALRERREPGGLMPDTDPTQRITSATVGPVSVEFDSKSSATAPVISIIGGLLAGLLGTRSRSRVVFLKRA